MREQQIGAYLKLSAYRSSQPFACLVLRVLQLAIFTIPRTLFTDISCFCVCCLL
jgi:hypothetical protein